MSYFKYYFLLRYCISSAPNIGLWKVVRTFSGFVGQKFISTSPWVLHPPNLIEVKEFICSNSQLEAMYPTALIYLQPQAEIFLGMGLANDRCHYNVRLSLTGWAHTQNFPWQARAMNQTTTMSHGIIFCKTDSLYMDASAPKDYNLELSCFVDIWAKWLNKNHGWVKTLYQRRLTLLRVQNTKIQAFPVYKGRWTELTGPSWCHPIFCDLGPL